MLCHPYQTIHEIRTLAKPNYQQIITFQPLRRAMARMGAPNMVPDHMDNSLNYKVVNQLKKLKIQVQDNTFLKCQQIIYKYKQH